MLDEPRRTSKSKAMAIYTIRGEATVSKFATRQIKTIANFETATEVGHQPDGEGICPTRRGLV